MRVSFRNITWLVILLQAFHHSSSSKSRPPKSSKDTATLRALLSWLNDIAWEVGSVQDQMLLKYTGHKLEDGVSFFRNVTNANIELRKMWNPVTKVYERGLYTSKRWHLPKGGIGGSGGNSASGGSGLSRQSSRRVVLAIPPQALMTPATAIDRSRSEPLASALWNLRDRRDGRGEPLLRDNITILALHLQCELAKGPASWWWPYLNSLPKQRDLPGLVGAYYGPIKDGWSDEALKLSPSLHSQIAAKRRARDRSKSYAGRFLPSEVREACGARRGWWWNEGNDRIHSGGKDEGGVDGGHAVSGGSGSKTNQFDRGGFDDAFNDAHALTMSRQAWNLAGVPLSGGMYEIPTLTPLLDLLNHRSGAARYTPLLTVHSADALAFAITEEGDDGQRDAMQSSSKGAHPEAKTFVLRAQKIEKSDESKGMTVEDLKDGEKIPHFGDHTFSMVPSLKPGAEIFHDYDGGFEEGGFGLGKGAGITDGELNHDRPPLACAIEVLATFGFTPLVNESDGRLRLAEDRACALLHFGGLVRMKDVRGDSPTGRRLLETCRTGNRISTETERRKMTKQALQLGSEIRAEVQRAVESAQRAVAQGLGGSDHGDAKSATVTLVQRSGGVVEVAEDSTASRHSTVATAHSSGTKGIDVREQHRRSVAMAIVHGELEVLKALRDACEEKHVLLSPQPKKRKGRGKKKGEAM